MERDCRRCYYSQTPDLDDPFYKKAVQPYIWFAAVLLFLSYVIGLLFTLRTHAAVIWSSEGDEKKAVDMSASHLSSSGHFEMPSTLIRSVTSQSVPHGNVRESQLYKRIVGQTLKSVGVGPNGEIFEQQRRPGSKSGSQTPHVVPPHDTDLQRHSSGFHIEGLNLSDEANENLVRQITEIAATTSAIATRDATSAPRKTAHIAQSPAKSHTDRPKHHQRSGTFTAEVPEETAGQASGGHDAPNWSRTKSAVILLTATLAYAIIAEILVNTVDAVLQGSDIDEKFLGITLFALVPNTTEFLVRSYRRSIHDESTDINPERYLLRHERQHRIVHGNWLSVRAASLFTSDSSTGFLQCCHQSFHRPGGDSEPYI